MLNEKIEQEIQGGLQSARELGKEVLFPLARRFDELFSSAVPASMEPGSRRARVVHRFGEAAQVLSHCSVTEPENRRTLDVQPMPGVLIAIEKSMISSDYRIDFEVVFRDNGTALVLARYDRILGSRWIAIVDASTVKEIPAGDQPDLYDDLVKIGAEIENHESDLYVKDSAAVREVLARHKKQGKLHEGTFLSKGERWLEVPFAYSPFWRRKPAG